MPVQYIGSEPDNFRSSFAGVSVDDNGYFNFWPIIVEKAYAKIQRNYDRIVGGTAREAFKILTGAPVTD